MLKNKTKTKKLNKLWLAIILLTILQLATLGYLYKQHLALKQRDGLSLRNFIQQVEEKRYSQPVISVSENRVYIPEAKAYVTLNDLSRNLRYQYRTESNSSIPASLTLTVNSSVGAQNESDNPSCDRMLTITASPSNTHGKLAAEITPLSNGLRYISQNEAACRIWQPGSMDKLIETAKTLTQY